MHQNWLAMKDKVAGLGNVVKVAQVVKKRKKRKKRKVIEEEKKGCEEGGDGQEEARGCLCLEDDEHAQIMNWRTSSGVSEAERGMKRVECSGQMEDMFKGF